MSINGKNLAGNQSGISLLGIVAMAAFLTVAGVTSSGCGGGGAFDLTLDLTGTLIAGTPATIAIDSNSTVPLTYTLIGAPAGMTIDASTGAITWTPVGHGFGEDTSYSFTVSATDGTNSASAPFSVTVADGGQHPIVRSNVKGPANERGIVIGDFENDGLNEMLVTNNGNLLYIMRFDAAADVDGDTVSDGQFYQDWVYPFVLNDGAAINVIAAADVNLDGADDMIVVNGSYVTVIDGVTKRKTHSINIDGMVSGAAVSAANIDNDTAVEIVVLGNVDAATKLYVLTLPTSGTSLVVDWSSPAGAYGTSMAVGNVDAVDANLEIVTSAGYVIDGVTLQDQWTHVKPPFGFGDQILLVDLDYDQAVGQDADDGGVEEIVGLFEDGRMEVYSPQHQSDLFGQLDFADPLTHCSIAKVDTVGGADLVAAGVCIDDGAPPSPDDVEFFDILSASTQGAFAVMSRRLRLDNTSTDDSDAKRHGGFISLAVGDVTNDGVIDYVWANKFSDESHYDAISVKETASVTIRQTAEQGLIDSEFSGAVNFRFSSTQNYALFAGRTNKAEYAYLGDTQAPLAVGGRLLFINYDTGRVSMSAQVTQTDATNVLRTVKTGNIVAPGADRDVVITTSGYNIESLGDDTSFQALDFGGVIDISPVAPAHADYHYGWISASPFSPSSPVKFFGGLLAEDLPQGFDLEDIDSDGVQEFVGFTGNYIFYYDFGQSQNQELWQSIYFDGAGVDLDIVDVDGDGVMDIVHLSDTTLQIRKRDQDSWHANNDMFEDIFLYDIGLVSTGFTGMHVQDFDGNGQSEIVVVSATDESSTVQITNYRAVQIGSFTVAGRVTDVQTGFSSNSLLLSVAAAGEGLSQSRLVEYAVTSNLTSANMTWQSPLLLGKITPHGVNYGPSGQLLIATENAMYITH